MRRSRFFLASALAFAACAGIPTPDPGEALVWGYVRLVPKQGTEASGSYGDRRFREVARVDYSQPGFSVVFAEAGAARPAAPAQLRIELAAGRAVWSQEHAAVARGGEIRIENATPAAVSVSAPEAAFVATLAAGETGSFSPPGSGELTLHLLGVRGGSAQVWVSPGPFAIAEPSGRYVLRGLAPGSARIRAWHPRLPPSAPRPIALAAGAATRLDLEIGLGHREELQP